MAKIATAEAAISTRTKTTDTHHRSHINSPDMMRSQIGYRLLSTSSFKTMVLSDSSDDESKLGYRHVRPKTRTFSKKSEGAPKSRPKSTSDVKYKVLPTPEELEAIVKRRARSCQHRKTPRSRKSLTQNRDSEASDDEFSPTLVSHRSMYLMGRSRRQLRALAHIDAISALEVENKRYAIWAKIMKEKSKHREAENKKLQTKVDNFVKVLKDDKDRQQRVDAENEGQRIRSLYQPYSY
uniref:Uncharacterized protein LOC100373191 n=1 Tax=Saccoglossus kowalevskii TaxID=10224 RepID=A0ABM0MXG2_SACKO|nr:PREDICTED: uncharacterized protein LOC100373191 [Saccoglossus kowalevskii]